MHSENGPASATLLLPPDHRIPKGLQPTDTAQVWLGSEDFVCEDFTTLKHYAVKMRMES